MSETQREFDEVERSDHQEYNGASRQEMTEDHSDYAGTRRSEVGTDQTGYKGTTRGVVHEHNTQFTQGED